MCRDNLDDFHMTCGSLKEMRVLNAAEINFF
jgi:hypothetical protein